MKSNNYLKNASLAIWRCIQPHSQFEKKLIRCQCYAEGSIRRWKDSTGFSRSTTNKILNAIRILNGQEIHQVIKRCVLENPEVFLDPNCFVTSFGKFGKSGDVVLYDFRKSAPKEMRLISQYDIASLPEGSRIVFVDDLIGTGEQSLEYVSDKLNLILNSSHRPCLFALCATSAGASKVRDNSGFDVICGLELDESFNHYHERSSTFTAAEKHQFKQLSARLGKNRFDLGLLLAFYYTVPNNTLPFIWKEGFSCRGKDDSSTPWRALLPRNY